MNKENTAVVKGKLTAVSFLKLLLILGVLATHSNIKSVWTAGDSTAGYEIVQLIVSGMRICVPPSFFIISGYLFFYGVRKFTISVYKEKLRRRFKTLFVPYVFWDTFCACLFLIKAYLLNFRGLGIIENGIIHWSKFFEGFIFIEEACDFPFAFAFWFIRNLMVFVILSPLVWLVARRWWSVALFFIIKYAFDIGFYGLEWFLLGAACSLNNLYFDKLKVNRAALIALGIIYVLLVFIAYYCEMRNMLYEILLTAEVIAAFLFLFYFSLHFTRLHDGRLLRLLYSATFFIYAFHQCFCSVNIKFWVHIFGCKTIFGTLLSFVASFLTLVTASLIGYIILKKCAPRFLNIITGYR